MPRVEREEAESTEAISHRESQRTECLSGGGSPAFGRHMDRETPRITNAVRFFALVIGGVSRSMPRVARLTASQNSRADEYMGRLPLPSVNLCAK